ncbi:radical SAM protein, partial [Paramuribaculum intestinale]
MIYVHVPFCRSKCAYCDFYSLPRIELAERYCDTLEAEWNWRRNETDGLRSRPTLYIGGGTPSALPRHLLQRIIGLLATPDMTEITIEVNPEDVDSEFVKWLDDTPVSRVSMGIQSLRDEELTAVGRRHTASDALKALDLLTASRLDVSADLIYGLPGQTPASFASSLAELTARRPEHLSCYLLSYEPG